MADVKILLVEDENIEAMDIKRTLESFGYEVLYIASSGEEAVEKAVEIMPDLILMDIILKGDTYSIELFSKIKDLHIPVIYLNAHSEDHNVDKSLLTGPYGYLLKPFGANELKFNIELALYNNNVNNELKDSEKSYREMVDNSMVAIYKTNLNGDILFANDTMVEMFDFESFEDFQTTKSPPLYKNIKDRNKIIEKLKKEGSFSHHELDMISHTGETITILLSAHLENNIISGMMMNITESKKAENGRIESEEFLENIVENIPDIIFVKNADKLDFKMVNKATEDLFGHSREKLLGNTDYDFFPKEEANFFTQKDRKVLQNKKMLDIPQETIETKNLGQRILHTKKIPILNKEGTPQYLLGISEDITELKKAEKKIRESEKKYREVVETAGESIILIDKIGNITEVNQKTSVLTGFERKELVGKSLMTLAPKMKMNLEVLSAFKDIIIGKEIEEVEWDLVNRKNGEKKTVIAHYSPLRDEEKIEGVVVVLEDITELKNRENTLNKSLEEKEMLLKEIHHRVKNNLMIISSLLNLQSSYIKDKASQDIFKESQNRARSMALIHERLYQSTDLKRIDFGDYITSLANELFHTYVADPNLIKLKIYVDDIFLDINTSIPLGLIVNELITNSLKHAFPDGKMGEINIEFHKKDTHYEFTVKDNGIGFPEDIDYQNTDSLGLQMVTSLTDQIDGEITLDGNNGTKFKITFKELEV
jgi:PAS domain S-box-containing protein